MLIMINNTTTSNSELTIVVNQIFIIILSCALVLWCCLPVIYVFIKMLVYLYRCLHRYNTNKIMVINELSSIVVFKINNS